jgi:purine-cytosine permease-like protein
MNEKSNKKYLFDNPGNIERLLRSFYAICIILVIVDFFVHRHVEMWWEKIPAFYALYGFVACVVLVIVAKMMRTVVMRKEDYYDE